MIDVSLCSACMNRNENLEKSLVTWIKLPVKEIIIVDWACEKNLEYLLKLDDRIKIVRVNNKKYYYHSAANNLKIKYATCNWIFSVDADILIDNNFFDEYKLDENIIYQGRGKRDSGIFGVFLCYKKWINKIGGFNEKMDNGWGYEDNDLYNRLKNTGIKFTKINKRFLNHISHSDDMREMNTKVKNINLSNKKNIEISNSYLWSEKDKKQNHNERIYVRK